MKIILSRKGFDSANGGIVSPIMEDGSLISFPIPSPGDVDTYDDLYYGKDSYTKILKNLGYKGTTNHCHVDPDLDLSRRKNKINGWFPAFGQIDASASYLLNNGVGVGDIFLFFGNFHQVENVDGNYRFVKRTGDFYRDSDLQVIWGYFQVGEVITSSEEQKKYTWHPHSKELSTNNKTNIIFKAANSLSFNHTLPGAGLLNYDVKRVLTAYGATKGTWKLNDVYSVHNILANRKNCSKCPDESIYYAGIWQELVLRESNECLQWAKNMVM